MLPALALAFLAGASPCRAQALPPLEEYHVRVFGPEAGLLNADVLGLAQTRDGYLHVASSRGLARFDGHEFHAVPLPGLRTQWVDWIYADTSDRLWLLTDANELGFLAGGRFRLLPRPPVRLDELIETSDGSLWGRSPFGLLRVDPRRTPPYTLFTTADGLPGDSVGGVFEVTPGEVVVVTTRALARVEPDAASRGGFRLDAFAPASEFGAAAYDARRTLPGPGGLWIRTDGGHLLRYHAGRLAPAGTRRIPLDSLDGDGVSEIHRGLIGLLDVPRDIALPEGFRDARIHMTRRGSDGARWLVSLPDDEDETRRGHLLRLRRRRVEFVPLREHMGFRDIQNMLEDREGSLWIGTDRGLLQLVPQRAYALTERHGLADGFTVPVLQTRDGSVWVGTWGAGLHRFAEGALADRFGAPADLPSGEVRALYEATDGTLWVGLSGHAVAIRDGRVTRVQALRTEVRGFVETPDGRLWAGTRHGLFRHEGDRFVAHDPAFWRSQSIWAVHVARDGALWIGAERGLFRIDDDGVRAFGGADGLRGDFVVSIHEEPDGTLWFGTYASGLHRHRGGRFVALTTAEGLHHDGVWRMLPDEYGGIWMSSDFGVFRVDRGRLHAVADAIEAGVPVPFPLTPLVFTESEGMPSRECNRASPGGWVLDDGRLVFNNLAGLVVIDPARALRERPPPNTRVQRLIVDGDTITSRIGAPPQLGPGTRHLTVEFAALSYIAPEQTRYRYRLDGYDDDWVEAGRRRGAAYTNLPPGRYTFRVQAATAAGPWTAESATAAFAVLPAFWQTWWFRLGALALLAGLLAVAHRYRVARMLELERMRLRIASDLHDEVGSNLSSIALLSEMLSSPAAGGTHIQGIERRQLERIHDAAEQTIGALRHVIWLVDPKHDTLADLVERMRTTADEMLNRVEHTFDAPAALPHTLDMTFMRNAFLIYKEALHNVVKHAGARRIDICIREHRGVLTLVVEDDGSGFDADRVRKGYGLDSMRRRAKHVGGTLQVGPGGNGGTRVTFRAHMA